MGYAPADSPTLRLAEAEGTVNELGTPKSDFLFIFEALGPDEVALGRNLVGPTGGIFLRLLSDNTPLQRHDVTVLNPVRCRPIAWGLDGKPELLGWNKDHTTIKPSTDQIRECTSRYFEEALANGEYKYIVACGSTAAYTMLGRQVEIGKARGTIYEPGKLKECDRCNGSKIVYGKPKKCPICKGRGTLKCLSCNGVTKHRKGCQEPFPPCGRETGCGGRRTIFGKTRPCPQCGGAGEVPLDPSQPHVCSRLKPGQLLMITYHPAYLMRNPTAWPIVERDFQRLTKMEEELRYADTARYDEYPPDGTGIAHEILSVDVLHGISTEAVRELSTVSGAAVLPFAHSITIDLETTGLDADSGKITHFAFTDRPGYGAVISPHDPRVHILLRRPTLVGQNIVLFDWWWLYRKGYEIPAESQIVDTRFLGKLINPDTPNDLPYLTSELADPPLRGYWKAKDDYRRHIERVACIDVDATTRVVRGAWDRLERTGQAQFVRDYIIPISRVVFESRCAGMKVDRDKMDLANRRIEAQLMERRSDLPQWGGTQTEGQHAQVQKHLYEMLKLPVRKKRGTWQVTADKAALDELLGLLGQNHKSVRHLSEEDCEAAVQFIGLIQELRDMAKLSSSFLRYKYSSSDMVHPELNPLGTATLRPTCADPNILQVPGCKCKPPCHGTEKHICEKGCSMAPSARCKNARWVFIPDEPDWEIMSVDLSQAEVVGFLWYAQQWDVLDFILNKGQDAYQIIANKIKGREATAQERDQTKVDTLAFIYGEGDRTQSLRLRIPLEEIRTRREVYLAALPGVQDFRSEFIRYAQRVGYVSSPWGVRRYIRVDSPRGRAANEACNAPIQNIPPMITGHAAIKLHAQLPKPARLWVPWVYDELNFVYPKELRSEVYTAARDILGSPVPQMPAPQIKMAAGLRFKLDFACGQSWGHLTKLDVKS